MKDKFHPRDKIVRFLEMLVNILVRKKLERQIFNFDIKYPHFTSSVHLINIDVNSHLTIDEEFEANRKKKNELKESLFGDKGYSNIFNYYYNLNQLEDMDPVQIYNSTIGVNDNWPNYFKKESLAHMFWGRGEYSYTYKKVLNEFRFKQNKFIEDPLERLNYLQGLIDYSSSIKSLNKYFYKVIGIDNPSLTNIYFSNKDFPKHDILQKIQDNNYTNIYDSMKKNLKSNFTGPNNLLKYVLESMTEIFDDFDFDFDFDIEKVYKHNDVVDNPKLKMLLGDINGNDRSDFKNSAILFKFKIWLIKDKIRSTNYIEDYLMGDIYYTNYY